MDNIEFLFSMSQGENKANEIVASALQEKLALDEPISKDDVISTIQGIDISDIIMAIIKKIVAETGAEFENVTSSAATVGSSTYVNRILLSSLNLPVATSIGDYAMSSCISLSNLNLPAATSIGNNVVANCISLPNLNLPAATSIGNYAMFYCISLSNLNLPAATSIGVSAMNSCISLSNLNLPVATSIGDSAMRNCVSLPNLNLPAATSIGNGAMYNCISLKSVRLGANQVCTLASTNAFENTPISKGTGYIYVPDELVDSYKTATNWSVYASQIRPMSEYVEE